jgi:hypothetical protein
MDNFSIDALVINRNLKSVTDSLVGELESSQFFQTVGVVDGASREEEISNHTVVRSDALAVQAFGLRINRGYNLAISWWINQSNHADYLLLLPNDTVIVEMNISELIASLDRKFPVAAIVPLPADSPYKQILPKGRLGIGWHFNEGPIILSKKFILHQKKCGREVFDSDNFRGYLSFIDLALRIYANNFCMIGTDLISFNENESHLQNHHDLIVTEEVSRNASLLLKEGRAWLARKHGLIDGISLENLVRLSFEEFIRLNPKLSSWIIR